MPLDTDTDTLLSMQHLNPADRAVLLAQRAAEAQAAQPAALPTGAPMVRGTASPMETAIRAKTKASQDLKLKALLLKQRGAAAAMPTDAPVINGSADILQ